MEICERQEKEIKRLSDDMNLLCSLVMPLPNNSSGIYPIKTANLYFTMKKLIEEAERTDAIVKGYKDGYAQLLNVITDNLLRNTS